MLRVLAVIIALGLLADPLSAQDLSFRDVWKESGPRLVKMWRVFDVEVFDFDGDGRDDLIYFDHRTCTNFIRNDGALHFTNVTEGAVDKGTLATSSAALADLDGDARPDVLNAQTYGESCIALAKGPFKFEKQAQTAYPTATCSVALADFDGDGVCDLLWSGGSRPTMVYLLGGGKKSVKLPVPLTKITSVFAFDVDGDGDTDILFVTSGKDGEKTALFLNDGRGNFTDVAEAAGLKPLRGPVAVGDFNGDGSTDILCAATEDEDFAIYLNDGKGKFARQEGTSGVTERGGSSYALAEDIDNDGDVDLILGSGVYRNDGKGHFTKLAGFTPGEVMTTVDLDGDGDLDLLSSDHTWINEGKCGNWLRVRAKGAGGNTYGVGSRISVYTPGPKKRIKMLVGSSEVTCASYHNTPLVKHFGLGRLNEVDVVVRFPSGKTVWKNDVKANRLIEIDEKQ